MLMPTWFLLHYKERPVANDINVPTLIAQSSDIVTQLSTILDSEMSPTERAVICAAASEIERLESQVQMLAGLSRRLLIAGDRLAVAFRTLGGLDVAHDAALRAWEEARRG